MPTKTILVEDNQTIRDSLVIDLFLQEGSGIGVLRKCRNRRPDQVALMLTNYPTVDVRSRCLELGADGIYDKSTELDAFFHHCSTLTRRARR